jgi:hypothetical protein
MSAPYEKKPEISMKKLLPNVASASTILKKRPAPPSWSTISCLHIEPKWPRNTNSIAIPRNPSIWSNRCGLLPLSHKSTWLGELFGGDPVPGSTIPRLSFRVARPEFNAFSKRRFKNGFRIGKVNSAALRIQLPRQPCSFACH